MFRQELIVNKYFPGVVGYTDFLERMKNWYHYGLNKRLKLSISQVNGDGGGVPKYWENGVEHICQSVTQSQLSQNKAYINHWIPGAT